jgi:septal ring factor EnvC (AmiA/AmiB activator)
MSKEELETDESITYTVHHPKWWDKWVNPTTMMVLFGAIVWGIQLNFAVLQNTKELGQVQATQQKVVVIQQEMQRQSIRLATLLETMERNQERNTKLLEETNKHVLEREKEAEGWKKRIEGNEDDINRFRQGYFNGRSQ